MVQDNDNGVATFQSFRLTRPTSSRRRSGWARALGVALLAASLTPHSFAFQNTPASSSAIQRRDLIERSGPDGSRLIALRAPEADAVVLRFGFACRVAPDELERLTRRLALGLAAPLGEPLRARGGALSLEFDDSSFTVVVTVPTAQAREALTLTLRALGAPRWNATISDAPRVRAMAPDGIALDGSPVRFGPAEGGERTPAERAALEALECLAVHRAAPPNGGSPTAPDAQNPLAQDPLAQDPLGQDPLPRYDDWIGASVRREALVLTLYGDLDLEAALQFAAEAVSVLHSGPGLTDRPTTALHVPITREFVLCHPSDEGAKGPVGAPGPDLANSAAGGLVLQRAGCRADAPDAAALFVVEEHLAETLSRFGAAAEQRWAGSASSAGPDTTAAPLRGPLAKSAPAIGVALAPGWGRAGPLVIWLGCPARHLIQEGRALLEALEAACAPSEADLVRARARALARLAAPTSALEELTRAQRLALRGAAPDWTQRLSARLAALTLADLTAALQRHVTPERMQGALWLPESLAGDVESLGTIVRPTPPEVQLTDTPVTGAAPRTSAEAALAMFETLGGVSRFQGLERVTLRARVLQGGASFAVTQTLDLTAPNAVVQVQEGGTTSVDAAEATWAPGIAGEDLRALPLEPLLHDTRMGLLFVLHQLAQGTTFTAQASPRGLTLETADGLRAELELDRTGRPLSLNSTAPFTRTWRFEDWHTVEGRSLPRRILDVDRDAVIEVQSYSLDR